MKNWIQLSDKKWKKPILRTGDFQKKSDGTRFSFTEEHLSYFADSFTNRIPVPLEHTTEPDQNRGWVTEMKVEEGVLQGIFEFSDLVEDPNIFDTSVFIPIEDGRAQPIEHVALTSYPVVDGLGKFEAIACSLVPVKEKPIVDLVALKANLQLSEDLTDENVVDVLTSRFKDLSEQIEASKKPQKIELSQVKEKHGKLFEFAKSGRRAKIDALQLSKAVQDKLAEVYCSDAGLALALSEGDADNFDTVIEALEQNKPLEFSERTGVQLSDGNKEESGLVADAKRRAELAAKKRKGN